MAITTELARPRATFVGGSDIAAVIGVSPWKTPYQLYLEKIGEYVEPIDEARQKLFRRGKMLEPIVIEMAREEYGLDILAANRRYTDEEYPFLSCEIDFEWQDTDSIENAEVKTVNLHQASQWGEEGTDEIPVYYTAQILFGLGITHRRRAICPALIGNDLRLYRVQRDDQMIAYLRDKACEFWAMVESRTPPPLTTLEDVKLAWPADVPGSMVRATDEIADLVHKHKLIGKSIAGDEAKREYLEMEIRSYMQDASEIVDSTGKRIASNKLIERKGYTVAPTSYRVFRT